MDDATHIKSSSSNTSIIETPRDYYEGNFSWTICGIRMVFVKSFVNYRNDFVRYERTILNAFRHIKDNVIEKHLQKAFK